MTTVWSFGVNPSISESSWLSVCSRSSLPPPRPGAPRAADGVDLVDEDDGRRRGLGLVEELADARRADADEELDELRAVHVEERHLGLAGHGARQERLAGARRPHEQDAARQLPAESLESLGRAQELDDLLQVALGARQAGHVVEANADVVLPLEALRSRAFKMLCRGRPTPLRRARAGDPDPGADDERPRQERHQERRPEGLLLGLDPHGHVRVRRSGKRSWSGCPGNVVEKSWIDLAVHGLGRLESAGHALAVDLDPLDLRLVDERVERRIVDRRGARLALCQRFRGEEQSHESKRDHPTKPGARAPRRLLAVGVCHLPPEKARSMPLPTPAMHARDAPGRLAPDGDRRGDSPRTFGRLARTM